MKAISILKETTMRNAPDFYFYGDFAGEYEWEVCNSGLFDNDNLPTNENSWFDLMKDDKGNVYAVFGEDTMTCQDAALMYYQIELEPNEL